MAGRHLLVLAAVVAVGLLLAAPGCAGQPRRGEPAGSTETFALPAPRTSGSTSLEEALAARRSVRDFAERALSLDQVGQLLWAAQGVTGASGGRTAPSAGALYPLRLYVVLPERVLLYQPAGHRARVWREGDRRGRLAGASYQRDVVADAPAVVVVAADVAVTRAKYGERAQRYADLEAGHATQNLLLEATALGLGAVPMGSFDDRAVGRAVPLAAGETPLYLVPVGYPAGP